MAPAPAPAASAQAAAATSATPAPTPRGPALWVVQDRDTTIFLFGTFHALDSRASWFDRSVRAAFDRSDQLVLETLVPEDPAELLAALARQSLSGPARAGEPVVGGKGASAAPSFVASAGQAMSVGRSMGMTVDNGADAVLRRAATASGKAVEGLESFEDQLSMFAGLPRAAAPARSPQPTASQSLPVLLGAMQSAWKCGDTSGFAAVLSDVRAHSPQTYQTLFVDRNAQWAEWIAGRLAHPGIVFVAVGTGHLIGPDSVQQQLAARGIASARIS